MNFSKHCLYFEEWVLIKYLRSRKINLKSKDYEIIVSILLKKLYEDKLNFGKCVIGFVLKDKNANDFPEHGLFSVLELEDVLSSKKVFEEDSDVDVVISKRNGNLIDEKGVAYQLKRFGLGKEVNGGTEEFINFLNKYKSYSKTDVRLMILMEPNSNEIDTRTVVDWLKNNNYPFKGVETVSMANDIITFIQFFPNPGSEEIPITDLHLDI